MAVAGLAIGLFVSPAAAAVSSPGDPGIGDSYYPLDGNGGYVVDHYDIRLSYLPANDRLFGTTTILATTTQDVTQFNLDFLLRVSSVLVNSRPAEFSSDGGELTITPIAPLPAGRRLTIVVRYSDTPESYRLYGNPSWLRTATGAVATNAPHIAPWWFPSNDHPRDKATFDVSIAVPPGVEALSNGELMAIRQEAPQWVRWSWRSLSPQAPYLAFLAIGQFDLKVAPGPTGQTLITAYSDALGANGPAARASVERTPEIIQVLENWFGPYPFETQGGVVVDAGLGYAMETQTRPVYDSVFFFPGTNTSVVAHELAHQWVGDSVSVDDWRDIWLNEGFATYAQFLWSDYEGEGTPAEIAQFRYDTIPADDPFWQVLPGNPGVPNQLHRAVYFRGAMTLQALRTAVGDDAFFAILRTWTEEHKYATATTDDFIALSEEVSGQQLDDLFTTWLFTPGKPSAGPNGPAATRTTTAKPTSYDKIVFNVDLMSAGK
ncbi:M1 family metallopeptidase [Actinophytocola sp.]|uniref:M1 family metallopeptidase n=1 Tax=Actinophytocola sp. TaxID=1872138 RepID=UPI002ED3A8D8